MSNPLKDYLASLSPEVRAAAIGGLRLNFYANDAVAFAEDILKFTPDPFQREMLSAPPGARVAVTCHRQAGKSQSLATIAAHNGVLFK